MNPIETGMLAELFSQIDDPRSRHGKRHDLMEIIFITICAVICGAERWADVELFGRSKSDWLKRFLNLPNGIPSHDTFGRVFSRIDAAQFQRCFADWMKGVGEVTRGEVAAMDGKKLRRSHDRSAGISAIHMASARARANPLVLGQVKVAERSNEITTIPELLRMLEVSGCIVTIDAMGCQKEIAKTIIDKGADYVLAVKKIQSRLHQDITDTFPSGMRRRPRVFRFLRDGGERARSN